MRILSLFLITAVFNWGCGTADGTAGNLKAADTQCQSGSASIFVRDGFLEIKCGCATGNGTIFPAPGNLTCQLLPGTQVVFFSYGVGSRAFHQIISTGTNSFSLTSFPIYDPNKPNSALSYAATGFISGRTYTFQDVYSRMTGTIIVP
jgi:hypothetical protein